MDKYIFDENNGLWYELQGDYYLPCLKLPEEEQQPIGVWGQRHRWYLKNHHKAVYADLLISGRLNGYLADIDRQAEELFLRLVNTMQNSSDKTLADLVIAMMKYGNSAKEYRKVVVD